MSSLLSRIVHGVVALGIEAGLSIMRLLWPRILDPDSGFCGGHRPAGALLLSRLTCGAVPPV